jgi:hypothetical protein
MAQDDERWSAQKISRKMPYCLPMFKSMLLPPPWPLLPPPPPDGMKTMLLDFDMVAVMSLAASNRRSCTSPCKNAKTQKLHSRQKSPRQQNNKKTLQTATTPLVRNRPDNIRSCVGQALATHSMSPRPKSTPAHLVLPPNHRAGQLRPQIIVQVNSVPKIIVQVNSVPKIIVQVNSVLEDLDTLELSSLSRVRFEDRLRQAPGSTP